MSINLVLVSVVIPSYNHGRFIAQAIESVLSQSFRDYELIIADDCSTDNSRNLISGFCDSRIRSVFFESNRGAVPTLNWLIGEARAPYVALLNSDDYWRPGKLQKQYDYMQAHPETAACFTWAGMVAEDGSKIGIEELPYAEVFNKPNRSQGQWLRELFYNGNCICHPSMLIRKNVYQQIGYYNPALQQLPDFDMWIRLLKRYQMHVLCEPLTAHRRLANGANTSAETGTNAIRGINESWFLYSQFFTDMADDVLLDGFQRDFINKSARTRSRLECEKAFLMLNGNFLKIPCQASALLLFNNLLNREETKALLQAEYGFTDKSYFVLSGSAGMGLLMVQPGAQQASAVVVADGRRLSIKDRVKKQLMGNQPLRIVAKKVYYAFIRVFHKQRS